VAVTDLAASIVAVQVPVPIHAPLHPVNIEVPSGAAVSATTVLESNNALQVEPQFMPVGVELIVPFPLPALLTERVKVTGAEPLRRIDTVLLLSFTTPRSGFPSRLKSLTATDVGYEPTATLVAGLKAPVPSPYTIDTVLLPAFATARSGLPSRFRSPIVTKRGTVPTATDVALLKAPPPIPRRIDTSLLQ
jgi:hypothetical protein